MKSTLLFCISCISSLIVFTSCNKELSNPDVVQTDSLKSTLPKQIIYTNTYDSSSVPVTNTWVVSIKYDTTNHTIQLYRDDTTNANPYDVLDISYTYNANAYLTGYKQSDDFGFSDDPLDNVTILRGADNKINYMVEQSNDNTTLDTVFYNYQSVAGGMLVTTIDNSYTDQNLETSDTNTYTLNPGNLLTSASIGDIASQYTFTYNTNSSLKSFQLQGTDISYSAAFTYGSPGIADGKTDAFLQIIAGKDYYLPGIKAFEQYIEHINADYDFLGISITDPYHVSKGSGSGLLFGSPISNTANYTYQVNAQGNVSKINVDGDQSSEVFIFKY